MEQNIEFARQNGFIKSFFGRIRHVPEVKSSNYTVRKFGERVAMNMPLHLFLLYHNPNPFFLNIAYITIIILSKF